MQDQIVSIPSAPSTTLSFDAQVYAGQNKIRRTVGSYTSLYTGSNVTDRVLDLAPAATLTLSENIKALVIATDQPLTITLSGGITLHTTSFLALDMPITSISILSPASNTLHASVHLTYIG